MIKTRKVVCVTTTTPTTSLTPGGGGGALTLLCPHTGSVLSSLRGDTSGQNPIGVSALSTFPTEFAGPNLGLAIAFGSTAGKKDDSYALLVTIRSAPLSPTLTWKCRLAESPMTAGLQVSPCGHYIVGGSSSGTLYVWKTFGGTLLRTVKAHFRSVTVMAWSPVPCGRLLVTGGADGMVHAFSLLDLVDIDMKTPNGGARSVQPIRTWTNHQLPVTALIPLSGGRMVSAGQDGQILIIELFSGQVLASIHLPAPITAIAERDHCLFVGTKTGMIYLVDLDEHAIHRTVQYGVTFKRRRVEADLRERVFGSSGVADNESAEPFLAPLRGHDYPITALAAFTDDSTSLSDDHSSQLTSQAWLVSGDEAGFIRVWDIPSRGCVRILQPWSHSAVAGPIAAAAAGPAVAGGKKQPPGQSNHAPMHPVTSIHVLEQRIGEAAAAASGTVASGLANESFGFHKTSSGSSGLLNLIRPLQKFVQTDDTDYTNAIPVPIWSTSSWDMEYSSFWDVSNDLLTNAGLFRNVGADAGRLPSSVDYDDAVRKESPSHDNKEQRFDGRVSKDHDDLVQRLRQELEVANNTIQRWETVNNQLMGRLHQQQKPQQQQQHK